MREKHLQQHPPVPPPPERVAQVLQPDEDAASDEGQDVEQEDAASDEGQDDEQEDEEKRVQQYEDEQRQRDEQRRRDDQMAGQMADQMADHRRAAPERTLCRTGPSSSRRLARSASSRRWPGLAARASRSWPLANKSLHFPVCLSFSLGIRNIKVA